MAQLPDEKIGDENADFRVNDKFEWSLFSSSYWQITNKNKAKKIYDGSWRTCYGNTVITIKDSKDSENNEGKIKTIQWNVQITSTSGKSIMIGLCKDTWPADANNYGAYATANGYMYYCANGYKYNASSNQAYGKVINGSGSTIIITLNVLQKSLTFKVDGQDYGALNANLPNGQYRLALDISSPNDEVTVLSEKIEYANNFLMILNSLKEWCNDIKSSNEAIKKEQEDISKNEKNLNIEKLLKNTQYISKIKQNRQIFDEELTKLNNNINSYEKVLHKYLNPPKTDNYKTWKAEDIVKWIITLDGGCYAQYTDKLLKALKENQMGGDDLKDLTKNDLFLFGVTVFKHRVNLMKHFEKLVHGISNDNDNEPNENDKDNDIHQTDGQDEGEN